MYFQRWITWRTKVKISRCQSNNDPFNGKLFKGPGDGKMNTQPLLYISNCRIIKFLSSSPSSYSYVLCPGLLNNNNPLLDPFYMNSKEIKFHENKLALRRIHIIKSQNTYKSLSYDNCSMYNKENDRISARKIKVA